ncbi:hypothetical protein ACQ3JU_0390 (plasmid) [Bradyrhizobium guangxiense]
MRANRLAGSGGRTAEILHRMPITGAARAAPDIRLLINLTLLNKSLTVF